MTVPDLTRYDAIILNTSAGKDSQAMLDVVVPHADRAGVRPRLVAVHADLGRIEWPGTKQLAAEHAAHYGLRFIMARNPNWKDLLERIEARGMWPDSENRYCTSEFKTAQTRRVMTQLVREVRLANGLPVHGKGARAGPRVAILNVLGLRAEESRKRARMVPFSQDHRASNGLRAVDEWLPIHDWSVGDVWRRIRRAGTRHHPAYDLGMPRLSCSFCVLASKSALVRAARARPALAAEYAALERRIGHRFRADLSMDEIVAVASTSAGEAEQPVVETWSG